MICQNDLGSPRNPLVEACNNVAFICCDGCGDALCKDCSIISGTKIYCPFCESVRNILESDKVA